MGTLPASPPPPPCKHIHHHADLGFQSPRDRPALLRASGFSRREERAQLRRWGKKSLRKKWVCGALTRTPRPPPCQLHLLCFVPACPGVKCRSLSHPVRPPLSAGEPRNPHCNEAWEQNPGAPGDIRALTPRSLSGLHHMAKGLGVMDGMKVANQLAFNVKRQHSGLRGRAQDKRL